MNRGAVSFNSINSLKSINVKVVTFLNVCTTRSNHEALQFWCVVNSLKTWKANKGVFWYSSARPRAFAWF